LESLTGGQLNKYECETVTTFNELEEFALVYSSSKRMINKFIKLGYEIVKEDKYGKSFKCPKKCISFRDSKPRKKRCSTKSVENLIQNKTQDK
jgi:hypothetical protein